MFVMCVLRILNTDIIYTYLSVYESSCASLDCVIKNCLDITTVIAITYILWSTVMLTSKQEVVMLSSNECNGEPSMADIVHFLVEEDEGRWIRMNQIRLATLNRLALHCFCHADISDLSLQSLRRKKIRTEFRRVTRRLRELDMMDAMDNIPLRHLPRYIEHSVVGNYTLSSDFIQAIQVLFTPSSSIAAVDDWLLAVDPTSIMIINLLLERNGLRMI